MLVNTPDSNVSSLVRLWPYSLRKGRKLPEFRNLPQRTLRSARIWVGASGWYKKDLTSHQQHQRYREWKADPHRRCKWEQEVMCLPKGGVWRYGALVPVWDNLPAARMGLLVPEEDARAGITVSGHVPGDTYDPFAHYFGDESHACLYLELANLDCSSEEDVLQFVNEYGTPRLSSLSGPQPYPLLVLAYDATMLRLTIQLAQAVMARDAESLRRAHIGLAALLRIREADLTAQLDDVSERTHARFEKGVWKAAQLVERLLLGHGLSSRTFYADWEERDSQTVFRAFATVDSVSYLIDACYEMLIRDLTAATRTQECSNSRCARLFYVTRADREYCSVECRARAGARRHYWREKEERAKDSGKQKKRRPRRKPKT